MIENCDFVVFSDDWGRHPSSCQHLFKRIAKKNRVLWVNTIGMRLPQFSLYDFRRVVNKFASWGRQKQKDDSGVIVYSPFMTPFSNIALFRKLNDLLLIKGIKKQLKKNNFRDPILVTTVPNVSGVIGKLGESKSVYYCVDDFSTWHGTLKEAMVKMEEELLDKAGLILAVSDELYKSRKSDHCPTFLFTHGVDNAHFQKCALDEIEIAEAMLKIPGKRIGYFGLFDERIDAEILKYISAARPEWSIAILGNSAVDTNAFKNYKNIYFLGQVDYDLLPNYAKAFDVCILPYIVGESTVTINPLKFKEYLATGKPVVATRLPEIEKYSGLVSIVDSKEEFVNAVDACLKNGSREAAAKRQSAVAIESWEFKAEEFSKYLPDMPKKKINVMHLRIITESGGGPEKTILLSCRKTDKEKFNVIAVYLKNKGDDNAVIRDKAEKMGVVLHEVLERGKFDWQAVKEIRGLVEKYKIDILDCHDYKSGIIGLFIARFYPVKVITTIHGWVGHSIKERSYYALEKILLRFFDKVISVHKEINRYLLSIGVVEKRLITIYNAIDADDFKKVSLGALRAELGFIQSDLLVGNVCRLSKEKDLTSFLLVAKKILSSVENAKFVIAGEGQERNYLEEYAKKLNIGDKVRFLGVRRDIKNIYGSLDLFILTSLREGLPNVILEAMAMEVPVVSTNVDGIPELIENGVNGLLFEPKDVEGIASGAVRILKDRQLAENFKKQGRKTVCDKFSFAARTKKMEDLYFEIMGVGNEKIV